MGELREVAGVVGEQDEVAVIADHVTDAGRDDRLAGGHVFQGLGRADRFGGVIERPRHQANVEPLEVAGKLAVGPLPEVVQVGTLGKLGGVYLDHWADQDHRPTRRGVVVGQRGDQVVVEPLINHTVVAQDWPRQGGEVARNREVRVGASPREVVEVHGGREAVDVGVPVALRLKEAPTPGEHHISAAQNLRFGGDQASGRTGEVGQFVHAVVHDHLIGTKAVSVRGEQRRIEPPDQRAVPSRRANLILHQRDNIKLLAHPEVGADHGDVRGDLEQVQTGRAVVPNRFFLDQDRPVVSQP